MLSFEIDSLEWSLSSASGCDAVSNRGRIEDSASGVTTYKANELNQYTRIQSILSDGSAQAEEPEWDENGNLGRYNGMDLRYDAMNRLVSVSGPDIEAHFTYDYRNRVTSRTFNGETTFLIYDDWNLIAEYDAAGQLKARYVHGPRIDEVILTVNDHGTFFHHHDALGSVTHLTDVDGVVVESYQYDVYGNVTMFDGEEGFLENSAIDNRFLFTGREYLAGLDLYDYRNRIYSADLGRFIQADPIRFDAGDVNIYRYVFNNPLRWVDPMGLSWWDAVSGVVKIHLGVAGIAIGTAITVGTLGGGAVIGGYSIAGGVWLFADGVHDLWQYSQSNQTQENYNSVDPEIRFNYNQSMDTTYNGYYQDLGFNQWGELDWGWE